MDCPRPAFKRAVDSPRPTAMGNAQKKLASGMWERQSCTRIRDRTARVHGPRGCAARAVDAVRSCPPPCAGLSISCTRRRAGPQRPRHERRSCEGRGRERSCRHSHRVGLSFPHVQAGLHTVHGPLPRATGRTARSCTRFSDQNVCVTSRSMWEKVVPAISAMQSLTSL